MKKIQESCLNPINDKKSFGRDVGKLVSGTVIAYVVALFFIPIITRIFSPDIYGVASVFISIVAIITVIACMRYEFAILLPKDDKDAGAVFLLCLIILVCVTLVCIPIMFLFKDMLSELLGNSAVKDYLFLVPIAVFIDGLYLALRYWNTRRARFGMQAATQALQTTAGSGMQFGLGVCGFVVPGSLIAGKIIGNASGMLLLLWQFIRYDFQLIKSSFSFSNIWKQMKRYKKFPMINTPSALLNTISAQLPVFILTGFFSSTVTGLYSLGLQIVLMPGSIIGRSISQVFIQRSSIAIRKGTFGKLVTDVTSLLIILSVLPFALLTIVGGDLFQFVFGSKWFEAGVYVQILGVWAFICFISSPLHDITAVLEIQEIEVIWNFSNIVTRFLSLLIGGILGNVYIALILYSISGIIVYGYYAIWLIIRAGGSLKNIFSSIKTSLIISLIFALIVLFISTVFRLPFLSCLVAIMCGIIYLIVIFKNNELVKQYICR